MYFRLFILSLFIIVLNSCTTNSVLTTDSKLAPAPKKNHTQSLFLIDLEQISGDTLYIDRKYFKEALSEYLKDHKAALEFNPNAHLIVNFTQTVLNENRFQTYYRDAKQYRIDRRVSVVVNYSMYGKSNYHNSFTYNVLVKSGSFVSYEDADRKAHIILFKQLGKMVGQRVLALRHKFH